MGVVDSIRYGLAKVDVNITGSAADAVAGNLDLSSAKDRNLADTALFGLSAIPGACPAFAAATLFTGIYQFLMGAEGSQPRDTLMLSGGQKALFSLAIIASGAIDPTYTVVGPSIAGAAAAYSAGKLANVATLPSRPS